MENGLNTVKKRSKKRIVLTVLIVLLLIPFVINIILIPLGKLAYLTFIALSTGSQTPYEEFLMLVEDGSAWVDQNEEYSITFDSENKQYALFEKASTGDNFVLKPHLGYVYLYEEQSKTSESTLLMRFLLDHDERKGAITLTVDEIYNEDAIHIFTANNSDLLRTHRSGVEGDCSKEENIEIVFYKKVK